MLTKQSLTELKLATNFRLCNKLLFSKSIIVATIMSHSFSNSNVTLTGYFLVSKHADTALHMGHNFSSDTNPKNEFV